MYRYTVSKVNSRFLVKLFITAAAFLSQQKHRRHCVFVRSDLNLSRTAKHTRRTRLINIAHRSTRWEVQYTHAQVYWTATLY